MNPRRLLKDALIHSLTGVRVDALARARTRGPNNPNVRVILAHGTPRSSVDAFRRQLEWVTKHFELIDFERFKRLLADPASRPDRPAALYTFDDGLLSNYEFGAPLLEEFGVRGVFFAVPGFAQTPDPAAAKAYYKQRLYPVDTPDHLPMSPAQLRDLAVRGHTIGNHTYSHVRLSDTLEADLRHEIDRSADMLESWIGRPVEAFAWTSYWNAISPAAYRAITARHRYVFTPCPGRVVAGTTSRSLLWRTNAEAWADPALARFVISGLADPLWALRRRRLAALLGVPHAG